MLQVMSECNARCLNGIFLCRGSDLVISHKLLMNLAQGKNLIISSDIVREFALQTEIDFTQCAQITYIKDIKR